MSLTNHYKNNTPNNNFYMFLDPRSNNNMFIFFRPDGYTIQNKYQSVTENTLYKIT